MAKHEPEEMPTADKLFRSIDNVRRTAKPLEPLWGYFLFRKALTSIVGDPGIGKSTIGYGMAKDLCLGHSFLEIYPEEPVTVLILDFESADSLVASRANLVIGDQRVPNFYIYNTVDYYIQQIADVLTEFCNSVGVNLIIIDNQTMAFNTRDENDNSEAARQMRSLRTIAADCNAAMIIFHHTSKANLSGTRKGTGAFARARLADVCINIDIPDEDNPDTIRFEVAKNRLVGEKVLWYLKKEDGQFKFVNPPLGISGQQTDTKVYKVQQIILDSMELKANYKYQTLVQTANNNGIDAQTTQYAIKKLVQQGRLGKLGYGIYIRHKI